MRPYNSAGEIAFHRGIGITLKKNHWENTLFVSYRKIDANYEAGDSMEFEDYVSSLQLSGLHRTASEVSNKNSQGQLTVGGNLNYTKERWQIGFNAVHYEFDKPINKKEVLYNRYALTGKKAGNYSLDYSYTYKNVHFFGEAAIDEGMDKAFINGLAISAHSSVDMSFLYRNISRGYQALYSSAFTENTNPINEKGFYAGINIRPVDFLRIDAYADFFSFPWVKYRTDAPGTGNDYMVQATFKPDKQAEIYVRFKSKRKTINFNPHDFSLNPVIFKPVQSIRAQFSYKLNSSFTIRSRVEHNWFDRKGEAPENGFLTYFDVIYKPLISSFSGNVRISYFETDGYNSRMYAFENDVLYSYSIPVFFNKGYRYYVNAKYDITRKLTAWVRFAQIIYKEKASIGSGLDEIEGDRKSELKFQIMYNL